MCHKYLRKRHSETKLSKLYTKKHPFESKTNPRRVLIYQCRKQRKFVVSSEIFQIFSEDGSEMGLKDKR